MQKRPIWLFLGGVLLALNLLAWPAPAHACNCISPPPLTTPATAFTQASAVFVGTVTQAVDRGLWGQFQSWLGRPPALTAYGMLYTFAVQDSWKGVTTTEVLILTGYGGGDCGFGFAVGGRYLVYALQSNAGNLTTSSCTRNASYTATLPDLTYLATHPTLPLTVVVPAALPWLVGLVALVVGLALGGFFLWRRRRIKP